MYILCIVAKWYQVSISFTLICWDILSTDAVAFSRAHFGAGIGTIYLDNVGCTGSETRLIDCTRSTTVSCSGGHSEDAGVRCQGLKKWCTGVVFWGAFFIKLQKHLSGQNILYSARMIFQQ